jgi:FAD/FMN-containing dehydrogenase
VSILRRFAHAREPAHVVWVTAREDACCLDSRCAGCLGDSGQPTEEADDGAGNGTDPQSAAPHCGVRQRARRTSSAGQRRGDRARGWYARKLGLSANSVTAIELVTPDGRFRRVDHEHDPDLFWALRGGGGNFGVVTALEVQLYVIPDIYAGVLFFPWERSSEVLHAWREWTESVPEEMTSVGRILQFPPIPDIPEPLRGNKYVLVEGIYMGDEASGRELMSPLRDLGPAIDTFAMVEPVGLAELHMDPPTPVPYAGAGHMLGKLDAAAIDRFVEAAGPASGSALVSSEIRHLGGELHRPKPGNGALATFDADFLTFGIGMVFDDASYRAHRTAIAAHAEAFAPYENGRQYLNFTEDHTDPARFYTQHTYRRLREVKRAYDPDNLIRANHPIPPA